MWNKEHKIYGYHIYAPGKPVVLNETFNLKTKSNIVTTMTPMKEGGLIESVAIVRHPDREFCLTRSKVPSIPNPGKWFIRARAKVHRKDDFGIATKARGRQIATDRVISALKYLAGELKTQPISVETVYIDNLTDREKAIFEKDGKAGGDSNVQ